MFFYPSILFHLHSSLLSCNLLRWQPVICPMLKFYEQTEDVVEKLARLMPEIVTIFEKKMP